ncbi:MAG: hypothetical protein DRR16_28285 [Candidatus Parabeggiatoa sp. nov. 3]|jgi:DNA integrity scanning protein DisA with diadenylate cyclase activity|nr:MAG: hypothetical protein DRR00_30260 [Gammaproteobacteria bacterium]RKZ59109.1 MAG: hypothetical protein DRQ99_24335 [Gammaproteobacteria bacterium]RKZ78136.1 MAG: hypothetical protein DRR16_28285 [Gammaproteobacteria bacterium]
MYKIEDVLDASYAILPHLTELLGSQAKEVEQQLNDLIGRAEAGEEDIDIEIYDLFGAEECDPARKWMHNIIKDKKIFLEKANII